MSKSTRSSSKLLPEIFQTEKNKRFITSTIDQLIEPSVLDRLSAYIGQRYRPSFRSSDIYLDESTAQRQNYQLEPTVTYKSNGNNIDFASQYIDAVNEIASQGGSGLKHDRLWEQESYAYAPPVDPDKLVNYRQYYWIAENLSPITLVLGEGTSSTINVTNNSLGAYTFSNKIDQTNPDIVVYKGCTYNFVVDAPGHPFYIKTQYGTGTANQFDDSYVTNNGADQGTVTLKVPANDSSSTADTILFYQCGNHVAMKGRIIIKDLEQVAYDLAEVEGCTAFTDSSGLTLTNTINVQVTSNGTSDYTNKKFFVDGVGQRITLTDISQHEVPEAYGTETTEVWDKDGTSGFDVTGFDNSIAQSTEPDYWTVNRASQDLNAWTRANRWVHIDAIKLTEQKLNTTVEISEDIRAKRPIIEFVPNLELYNHGNNGRLIDVIDTDTTDALSKVQGEEGYFADGTELRKGDLVIFTADPNQQKRIFSVDFIEVANELDSTTVIQLVLTESFVAGEMLSVTARRGNNKGKTYHVENDVWTQSQQKTRTNQKPKFDVFDHNHVSLGNLSTYISSNFTGSTLFEIATDTQGTPDTVYGQNVIYDRLGLINDLRINDTFNSDTFQYVDDGVIVEQNIRQFHFHQYLKGSTRHLSLNNWNKFAVTNSQKIIKIYTSDIDQHYFQVDHYKNAFGLSDLTVQVLLDGVDYTAYTLETINNRLYVKTTDVITPTQVITVKAHSTVGVPSGTGFFEVPVSLQRNALNKNFTKLTLGDISKHYRLAVNEMSDFTGSVQGVNNSRDLDKVFDHGSLLMQHSGNDPLAHILVKDDVMNLAKSMRHSGREYEKIKQNLIARYNEISLDGTAEQNLERLFELMNANKTSTMPFYDSDMIGISNDKTVLNYSVVDTEVANYPISSAHNLTSLSKQAVYVYLNNSQLLHGQDYELTSRDDSSNQDGIEIKTVLSVNDKIRIVQYSSTDGNFVPATPTKLGLAPKFEPIKFKDDTFQTSDGLGIDVIRGHDGSVTVAYGDERDDILLEFERKIFNNIKVDYDEEVVNINYGFFRNNEYTNKEILDLFARDFYTWTGTYGVDYSTNNTYDASNDFTWNFSKYLNSIDNTLLPGHWRAIYRQWFDTEYPHKFPWQIFGFMFKPAWWDERYGSAPYTRGNLLLWKDIEQGFIARGERAGYYAKYAKPGVLATIPVTDTGDLAPPTNAGIIGQSTVLDRDQSANWVYGDGGPAESAWRRSSSYRFAEQVAKFLAKPGRYAGLFVDVSRVGKNILGQFVYNDLYRQSPNNLILPSATSQTSGWINVIVDYVKHLGYSANTYVADRFDNISVQLSYKLGGFTNKDNLQVAVGSVSPQSTSQGVFLPQEDFEILLYKSAPVVTANYSGVIVQKTDTGYKISGYSNYNRTFEYFAPKKYNDFNIVNVGATTQSFTEWQAGGFYVTGSIVRNAGIFYRAKSNISSGQTFDATKWNEIGFTLPLQGGVTIKKYKNYEPDTTTVPYGTEFKSVQEIADFLFGYSKHLENQGFIFDNFVSELQNPADWQLSVKEFLFWTTQNWNTNAVITLSPAAQSLKFKKENTIGDDLTDTDQFYTVLQQDGLPINPSNFTTKRQDGIFELITNPVEDGIYNADIRAVQKEHVILLDNTSQFNDVIFDDVLGNRQDRVKLVGFRTANWNGDLYSPGYVIDQAKIQVWSPYTDYRIGESLTHQSKTYVVIENHTSGENFSAEFYRLKTENPTQQMLPNWDAKAEAFRDFYSLDSDNFDAEQQRYAQHLIGYQQRDYFTNLGLEELTQFKFYQGMLKEKGTVSPIQKFKSQPQSGQDTSFDLFEEYAFRIGEYGGNRTQQAFAFVLDESRHKKTKYIYSITERKGQDTETVLNIGQNNGELFVKPYAFDGDPLQTLSYSDHANTTQSIFTYPMAGYVLPSQVSQSVFNEEELLSLNVDTFTEGHTIWIANTVTGDWDVKRFNSLDTSTISYKQFDSTLQITTNESHGIDENDYVVIVGVNNSINGIYKASVSDSTDNDKTFSVQFDGTFDSTNVVGSIGTLKSIRINSMDDLDTITPDKGFQIGDYVYVDNNYEEQYPNNGLWKVYQKSKNTDYTTTDFSFTSQEEANGELGTSIAVSTDNLYLASSAPGVNKVFVYLRSTTAENLRLRNDITLDIGNSDASDRFGQSLTMTTDGKRLFAGSHLTSDIVKLTLSATDREYTRGTIITGANSGAQGKILDVDWNNDIIWVKNIGATNFENEPLDIGDSSSVLTVTSVVGSDAVSQGAVHWINRDARLSFGINQTIVNPSVDQGGQFGYAVSVSGDGTYLAVGSPGSPDDSANAERGAVYIFKYAKDGSSARYDIHQTLVPDADSQIGSKFGEMVSFAQDGNTFVVGAPKYDNDSTSSNEGRVYVYSLSNDTFYETASLQPDTNNDYEFGTSVALSETGNDLLVGAPRYSNTEQVQGGIYHYTKQSSTFIADGSTTEYTVDFTIDQSINLAVFVGNTNYVQGNDSSTIAYYTLDGSTNTVTLSSAPASGQSITISQYLLNDVITSKKPQTNEGFGQNIVVQDNALLVQSSRGNAKLPMSFDKFLDDGSTEIGLTTFDEQTTKFIDVQQDSGRVYVYNKLNTQFKFVQNISPGQSLQTGANYGNALALSGLTAYIGAPNLDTTYTASGRLFAFEKGSSGLGWNTAFSQPNLIDTTKITKSFLYNKSNGLLLDYIPIIDPAKGRLFPEIQKNIDYITKFDPANYSSWDDDHTGEIWLDVGTFKFVWYEQGSSEDKLVNWAKLHPQSSVQVKQWISSDLKPEQYNTLSDTNEGAGLGITGQAEKSFVTKRVFDSNKSKFVEKYFYWVANGLNIFPNKSVSSQQVARSLEDPTSFSSNYVAFTGPRSVLINIDRRLLSEKTTAFRFENTTDADQLPKHSEHVLVAKDDQNSEIPQYLTDKFYDSLIGFDKSGRTVPDMSQPEGLRYGNLNRPRQSWYKDRVAALKIIVQFINDKFLAQPFATTKDLTKFNEVDPLPSAVLGEYDISVDTDVDLTYVNTDEISSGYKVLVLLDSTSANGWAVYQWNGTAWNRTSQQTYDTRNYWSYVDWYAEGYDRNLVANYVVDDERTRLNTTYSKGDIVKVQTSYDGEFRFYEKTSSAWNTIAIENGTIQLSTGLYDYASNQIGFGADAYGSALYDAEAVVELRNILDGIKSFAVDEDALLYNQLFFLGVRIAQLENKQIDWVFKTSFVKSVNTYSNLEQLREFQIETSESINKFLREVLPFKTTVREDITAYNNRDNFAGDITDFDNRSYYEKDSGLYVAPAIIQNDSTQPVVYDTNPWKQYAENYTFTIGSVVVDNQGAGYTEPPVVKITGGGGSGATAVATISDNKVSKITVTNQGSGYVSTPTVTLSGGGGSSVTIFATAHAELRNKKVRSFDTEIKFDRVNTLRSTENNTIVDWTKFTTYTAGQNIRYLNEIYRVEESFTSGNTFEENVLLSDSSSIANTNPIKKWTATDRIHAYYDPSVGMAGLIGDGSTTVNAYSQLMNGVEYPGVKVSGLSFTASTGYDLVGFDNTQYDTNIVVADAGAPKNLDQILDSRTFTTELGTRAEDINVVGDAFISEYSAHAPEEVLPGGVYDTMDLKVYTRQTDNASNIFKKTYSGDGSTKIFATPQIASVDGLRVFVNNNFRKRGTDYTVDHLNNKITFTIAPQQDDVITITVIQVSTNSLLGEFTFIGDGTTDTFSTTVNYNLVTQSYVLVNGVKTSVTIEKNVVNTDIKFATAPPQNADIQVFLFDLANGNKAFSEVVTTEYTQIATDSTEFQIQIDPKSLITGPYHHKVLVEGVSGTDNTNRYRLEPPQVAYYEGDGSTADFLVPNEPVDSDLAGITDTEVWLNGVKQDASTDFILATNLAGRKVVSMTIIPVSGDVIAVVFKSGHDYELDGDGKLTLQSGWNDDSSINAETVFVTTFSNHDTQSLRTELFKGSLGTLTINNLDRGSIGDAVVDTQDLGDLSVSTPPDEDFGFVEGSIFSAGVVARRYRLSATPLNTSYVFLSVNKSYLTANKDYILEGNEIFLPERNLQDDDVVTITYVAGAIQKKAIGYRIFKDILNRYHYKRMASAHSTKLVSAIDKDSTEILVEDASVLGNPDTPTNTPGVVFIGKERIAYFEKDGNTLKRLFRGTLGTSIQAHVSNVKVVDAGGVQSIPYEDTTTTTTYTGDGSTVSFALAYIPSSKQDIVVFVGGSKTTDFTIGSDSASAIVFDVAPASGVQIDVIKKTGSVWYDQGTSSASNGLGIQQSTGKEIVFLQDKSTDLTLF